MPGTTPDVIYLDYNATTFVHPQVREAMLPWLGERWGNPSSAHAYGRHAAQALRHAREQVAALIGGQADEIVFTSGGTEADNLAIFGPQSSCRRIVVSAVEHPAVEAPSRRLEQSGWTRDELPVDARGLIDLARARALMREPAGILSVILAQNETGVLQPVAELARMAREANREVIVHTDGAQAVGKIPVRVDALGIDLLTIVGHKLYAPCGIGALWVRAGLSLEPRTFGGGQERGLRPGTEPIAMIVGLGAACQLAASDLATEAARHRALRELLWRRLHDAISGITRTGEGVPTLPNTLHVRLPNCSAAAVLAAAPEVAASTGSACHTDDDAPSGVLGAMGWSPAEAAGALRLTLGRRTTEADIERAAAAIAHAFSTLRS
jgi:cysteine desulfurase